MENKEHIRGLKVDNDTREAIIKIMKMKRTIAWFLYFASMFFVVGAFVFLIMRWPGTTPMYFGLPISIVLLLVSIYTLSTSSAVEKALKMNNQSAFDEAMSKWNKRNLLTFGGYIILVTIVLLYIAINIIISTISNT